MHKLKPLVARTPEDLAMALGLSAAEAKEWQVHHALLTRLKKIVQKSKLLMRKLLYRPELHGRE